MEGEMPSENKVMIIADYFVYKNTQEQRGLTNKKLQKLLYYAQAWSLVINDVKLFDDNIEAWVHGPAVPSVYFSFKDYGFKEITKEVEPKEFSNLSKKEIELLDNIWDVYGKLDGNYLELLTHNEQPWQEARKELKEYENSHNTISLELMKSFYGKKIKNKS